MIEKLIYRILGTLIAITGVSVLIGGFTWVAVRIWTAIIGMLLH